MNGEETEYAGPVFGGASMKIRDLEEKQRILKDRLLLIGQNLIEIKEKNNEDILEIKKNIEIINQNIERLTSFLETASSEFSKFAKKAPVLIVILARLNIIAHRVGKQIQNIHFHLLDIGIAGEHIVLQAEELGLGTCWIGWFNTRKARKVLKIPRGYKITSLLSMGYYEQKPSKLKKRKELDEVVWFNEIGRKMN